MHEDYDALNRRQFFQLSGVIGGSAILTGAGLKLGTAHPLGGPDPKTCGDPKDADSLWGIVQACNNGNCRIPQGNADTHVFPGTNTHNFLTVPKVRVNGIECPWICETGTPNYWQDAWKWARTSPTTVDTPVGLGINSKDARKYNQLHIHMAQVRKQSLADLKSHDADAAPGTSGWSKSRVSITGYNGTKLIPHVYRVLKLGTFGGSINLFALLRNMVGQPEMEHQTLIVIPRPSGLGGGYYIVNSAKTGMMGLPNGADTCDPLLELPH